jgi:hypothetical protein
VFQESSKRCEQNRLTDTFHYAPNLAFDVPFKKQTPPPFISLLVFFLFCLIRQRPLDSAPGCNVQFTLRTFFSFRFCAAAINDAASNICCKHFLAALPTLYLNVRLRLWFERSNESGYPLSLARNNFVCAEDFGAQPIVRSSCSDSFYSALHNK